MAEYLLFNPINVNVQAEAEGRDPAQQLVDLARTASRRRSMRSRQQELRQELSATRVQANAYRSMARYAIGMTSQDEVMAQTHMTKRHQLSNMWRNMQQRVAFRTGRGL